jgi:hypothetical protein
MAVVHLSAPLPCFLLKVLRLENLSKNTLIFALSFSTRGLFPDGEL